LFSQKNAFFFENGVVLALLAGIVLAWMVWSSGETAKSA